MMPSAGSTAIPAPLYAATPAASASTPEPTMFFARSTTAVVGAMLPAGCGASAIRGASRTRWRTGGARHKRRPRSDRVR